MAQDIMNENQKISYTNLDFSAIYAETIDLIKQLTYKWDPSISNESDPGVVLVKLSALLADKCNYNIDKNILETFPLSVTQDGNARQLYDQLGYYMDWYQSGVTLVTLTWKGETASVDDVITYRIPKFTTITDNEQAVSKRYTLIGAEGVESNIVSDVLLTNDGKPVVAVALEGLAVQYQYEGETVITAQMVDPISRRLYFSTPNISQNGIFIKNTNQENYASWNRVNNLYEDSAYELRYIFGYDSNSNTCYLEFPDNYTELFGSGLEITYLLVDPTAGDIKAGELTQFLAPVSVYNENNELIATLSSDNVNLTNYLASTGHKNVESINEAYGNYKKTVGTFKTLITLRDYANYIRNKELDICSNAFVCDRTNDIQTSYKIINKSHGLDNLLIKVEQAIDNTKLESTFSVKYVLSNDSEVDPLKKYYMIVGDELIPVEDPEGSPKTQRYYVQEGEPSIKTKDAMDPFSLKFYLLRKSIAIDNKAAYNETFNILNPYPDLDSLFANTSHIEHDYENLLSLGESAYIKSLDTEWDENKSYWYYDEDRKIYSLITDISTPEWSEVTPAEAPFVYEIAVEALMPHTVMFKAVYPVTMNISTYNVLDSDTQSIVLSNIIKALYPAMASSEMNWGEQVSVEYLSEMAKKADDRIKAITIEPISYELRAVYYDKEDEIYKEVIIDSALDNMLPTSYRNINSIISAQIKQDIFAKSVLAGVSQLLIPDTDFEYHLSHKVYRAYDGIAAVESEARISIRDDAGTSNSQAQAGGVRLTKSYTLKDNEMLTFFRPEFITEREFLNGVHYEYVLYSGIKAGESYKLTTGEYIICYTPMLDDDQKTLQGYKAYACGKGCIVKSSFEMTPLTGLSSLSNFARSAVIPNLISDTFREFTTVNNAYITEIQNSANITNNKITGSNALQIKSPNIAELQISDKFKFFWILNKPTYSSNENLKTYTLFDSYDAKTQSSELESINSYTLKEGEHFIYTNNDYSIPEILGAGTTIIRNCGVNSPEYYDIKNSIYFAYWNKSSQIVPNSSFKNLLDNHDLLRVREMGLYEQDGDAIIKEVTADDNPFELGLYERLVDISLPYFVPTSDTEPVDGHTYYEVNFKRTLDAIADTTKAYYVLVMRKDEGSYALNSTGGYILDSNDNSCFEIVDTYVTNSDGSLSFINPIEEGYYKRMTYNNEAYQDTYSLYANALPTKQYRFVGASDVLASTIIKGSEYLEHDSDTVSRNIFSEDGYRSINISDTSTYTDIDISEVSLANMYTPIEYETYYQLVDGEYVEYTDITPLLRPADEQLYIKVDEDYYPTFDRTDYPEYLRFTPKVIKAVPASNLELFQNTPIRYQDNIQAQGYYSKANSLDNIYRYSKNGKNTFISASTFIESGNVRWAPPLEYLFDIYVNYTTSAYDTPEEAQASTTWLETVTSRWTDSYSFNKPYYNIASWSVDETYVYDNVISHEGVNYRCIVPVATLGEWIEDEWVEVDLNWRGYSFTATGETIAQGTSGRYIKVSASDIVNKTHAGDETNRFNIGLAYPAFECVDGAWSDRGAIDSYFYIEAYYYDKFGDISMPTYTKADKPDVELDNDYKLSCIFPKREYGTKTSSPNLTWVSSIEVYYLPKLFKFNDFVVPTRETYYQQKKLFKRICDPIDPWVCTALDTEKIINDPIGNIKSLWTSLQQNTSLTIIGNEILSFGAGDTVTFTATSSDVVEWPTFTNQDTILNLDEYSVAYTRKGGDASPLEEVSVDEYKWKGYSSLQLNLADKGGQRLAKNHSVSLYASELAVDPIDVISGDIVDGITIQFKNRIENSKSNFIKVATVDSLGNEETNAVYAFTSFPNGTYYKYDTSDYSTSLYFNSLDTASALLPQTIEIPIGLPGGEYLLPIQMFEDVHLTIVYDNRFLVGTVAFNIDAPVSKDESGVYEIDPNYVNYLYSYRDDTIGGPDGFTGNNYDFPYLYNGESSFRKLNVPSKMFTTISPQDGGAYEWDDITEDYVPTEMTALGTAMLLDPEITDTSSPVEEHWYEETPDGYLLSEDESPVEGKIYKCEPSLYVPLSDVTSKLIFTIDKVDKPYTYVIEDIFKFRPNQELEDFELIREKIKRLDVDNEYNYTFIPKNNDLISNPLVPKSFFNTNHIYNKYIIPQMDFDELDARFITTRVLS